MTDLYRPNRKRTPRLKLLHLKKDSPAIWGCYGFGCWGFGETIEEAYRTWAEDYRQWGFLLLETGRQ